MLAIDTNVSMEGGRYNVLTLVPGLYIQLQTRILFKYFNGICFTRLIYQEGLYSPSRCNPSLFETQTAVSELAFNNPAANVLLVFT